jgi:phosphatidylglycerophosphatase A
MQYYNPNFLICTFFGISKIFKRFPGTVGSLIAIPAAYLINELSSQILSLVDIEYSYYHIVHFLTPILITALLFVIGVYASEQYIIETGKSDPQEIIIDEIVAQTLCLFVTIPITFALILNNLSDTITVYYDVVFVIAITSNVVIFRFFDIIKPWPIRYFEKKISGGIGVMFDDILAALFTIVIYFAILLTILDLA